MSETYSVSRVVQEQSATVYRGGGRRWLTKRAAYRAAARTKIMERCECEPGDEHVPLLPCRLHEQGRYVRLVTRLARFYERADRRAHDLEVKLNTGKARLVDRMGVKHREIFIEEATHG